MGDIGMYEYHCEIVRVIDGDTVDVDIDLGFDCWLHNQRIRLRDIDAPEVRTRDLVEKELGLESKAFVESMLPVGSKQVLLSSAYHGDRGKYGRIIGTFKVYDAIKDRWSDLSTVLVEQGYADPY